MPTAEEIKARYEMLSPLLDERGRRLLVGAEARIYGRGGIVAVAKATETSRNTVRQGVLEVESPDAGPGKGRVRRRGGGRKLATQSDPGLEAALDELIEPATRGDPGSPLRWVSKSTRHLAKELTDRGHPTNQQRVAELLHRKGFSLQANRKTEEGGDHPDRNGQFEYISEQVKTFQQSQQPVISVDAKKKELVGNFKNGGREWLPEGQPEEVRVYDFIDELGRATPYGVYDVVHNEGWVSVGKDHDTAAFAVSTIRTWWEVMGKGRFPNATSLLITADGGGSNSSRSRLWKKELQGFATDAGLSITVCHLPPGTSKWNKIEHRMFSFIAMNWRGQPLRTHEIIVSLIASTSTSTGLHIGCELDPGVYPLGVKVPDDEMESLNLRRHAFHGEWNYSLEPENAQVIS